jgi:hypothetical protein
MRTPSDHGGTIVQRVTCIRRPTGSYGARWCRRPTLIGALLFGQTAPACSTGREEPLAAAAGGHAGNAAAGSGSALAGSPAGGSAATLDPGRKELHRLNTVEYNMTIADVLATTLQPANGNWRGGELSGFDNIASVLGIDEGQY